MKRKNALLAGLLITALFCLKSSESYGQMQTKTGRALQIETAKQSLQNKKVTLSIALSSFAHKGGSYMNHAEAFGHPKIGETSGFSSEAKFALTPSFRIGAAYSAFGTEPHLYRDTELSINSKAMLGVVELDLLRYLRQIGLGPIQFRISASLAAGAYRLSETFRKQTKHDWSPGGRAMASLHLDFAAFTIVVSEAFHYSDAKTRDLFGGAIRTAGFETSLGMGIRF